MTTIFRHSQSQSSETGAFCCQLEPSNYWQGQDRRGGWRWDLLSCVAPSPSWRNPLIYLLRKNLIENLQSFSSMTNPLSWYSQGMRSVDGRKIVSMAQVMRAILSSSKSYHDLRTLYWRVEPGVRWECWHSSWWPLSCSSQSSASLCRGVEPRSLTWSASY